MKRKITLLSLAFLLAFTGVVFAAGVNGQYKNRDIVQVKYEGKTLTPDDVPGQMLDGRTMIPVGLLRKAGFDVQWDAKTLTANIVPPAPRTVPVLIQSQLDELSKYVYKVMAPHKDDPSVSNQGSGFIIDGYLITAKHVAADMDHAEALINGNWQRLNNSFVSDKLDAMGFKVSDGTALPYATELPQVGDPVYSIGFPHGTLTITEGQVLEIWQPKQQLNRGNGVTIYTGNGVTIRHSAKIESGSSGSFLLNGNGRVVGLNTSTLPVDGVEANLALSILDVIKEIK